MILCHVFSDQLLLPHINLDPRQFMTHVHLYITPMVVRSRAFKGMMFARLSNYSELIYTSFNMPAAAFENTMNVRTRKTVSSSSKCTTAPLTTDALPAIVSRLSNHVFIQLLQPDAKVTRALRGSDDRVCACSMANSDDKSDPPARQGIDPGAGHVISTATGAAPTC